jgi:hypothetical protein
VSKKKLAILLALSVAAGVCVTNTRLAMSADNPAANSESDVESSLRALVKEARYLQPLLDRTQFELGPLLDARNFDAEEIVRFITDEIDLEIYPGALRGARGTLVSGAGNSLGQSLLLATPLKDAGFEASKKGKKGVRFIYYHKLMF